MSRRIENHLIYRANSRVHGGPDVTPATFAVFAWVLSVMRFEAVTTLEITASQIHLGVGTPGELRYRGVGLSLNTVKKSLAELGDLGWLNIDRVRATKGEHLTISISEVPV